MVSHPHPVTAVVLVLGWPIHFRRNSPYPSRPARTRDALKMVLSTLGSLPVGFHTRISAFHRERLTLPRPMACTAGGTRWFLLIFWMGKFVFGAISRARPVEDPDLHPRGQWSTRLTAPQAVRWHSIAQKAATTMAGRIATVRDEVARVQGHAIEIGAIPRNKPPKPDVKLPKPEVHQSGGRLVIAPCESHLVEATGIRNDLACGVQWCSGSIGIVPVAFQDRAI